MRLSKDFNEIVVQETPGCLWLFGFFFALIGGAFVYGALGGFSNYDSIPEWQIALTFVMGAIAVAAGIWIIYRAPVSKIIINRRDETIELKRIGLFGKRMQTFRFEEIKQFFLLEETDDESNQIWSLAVELTGGETIKISALPSHTEQFKRDFVFEINGFMSKPLPSYRTADDLPDESGAKMS